MRKNAVQLFSIFVCALALLVTTLAFAQDTTTQATTPQNPPAGGRHMRGDRAGRLQNMVQQLNLTDDQKAKIQPLLQDEAQQLKALHADASLTPEQRRAKAQEIHQATRAKIEPLLTPEQVAKLPQPGMGPGGPGGHHGRGMKGASGPGGNQLQWMGQKLNLTDDQKAKIEPLFAEQQKQVQTVKQDTTLTAEQKQAKIKELRKATHQQVMSILTPEQQQQMKEMRGMRQQRNGPPPQGTTTTPPPPPAS